MEIREFGSEELATLKSTSMTSTIVFAEVRQVMRVHYWRSVSVGRHNFTFGNVYNMFIYNGLNVCFGV